MSGGLKHMASVQSSSPTVKIRSLKEGEGEEGKSLLNNIPFVKGESVKMQLEH